MRLFRSLTWSSESPAIAAAVEAELGKRQGKRTDFVFMKTNYVPLGELPKPIKPVRMAGLTGLARSPDGSDGIGQTRIRVPLPNAAKPVRTLKKHDRAGVRQCMT
jgi:hypothetical protein